MDEGRPALAGQPGSIDVRREARGRVFVTGGAGYCGSALVPRLLRKGWQVTVYDALYFGAEFLPHDDPALTVIEGDIRDTPQLQASMAGHGAVVSLACISNDASFELDPVLSTSVNLDAFEPMVLAAKSGGLSRFIYASSSSVYGVSDQPEVTEDHPLVPLTLYNKYKGMCEPLLMKHLDSTFTGVAFRPATVCGYAPRQRLDLSVNILTNHAVNKGAITVFGGSQMRPNLHISDYCRVVEVLLEAPAASVSGRVFNVGSENLTIARISEIVKSVVEQEYPDLAPIPIAVTSRDDPRSYHINSDRIAQTLGFIPEFSVAQAVRDLCSAFKAGLLPDSLEDDRYFNVRRLLHLRAR